MCSWLRTSIRHLIHGAAEEKLVFNDLFKCVSISISVKFTNKQTDKQAGAELGQAQVKLEVMDEVVVEVIGFFIMNATKVFLNKFYSKAPYELKLVPYFHGS